MAIINYHLTTFSLVGHPQFASASRAAGRYPADSLQQSNEQLEPRRAPILNVGQ